MKKLLTRICVQLFIVLVVTSFGVFPISYTTDSHAEDLSRAFIDNALPVDLSKYNITLESHTTIDVIPILGADGVPINMIKDTLQYTLKSEESTLRVRCRVQNNVVYYCSMDTVEGQVISEKQYVSLIDAAKSFLEKYQTYSKIDSVNLIDILDNADVTKNSSTIIGNTRFTISSINYYGVERIYFKWAYTLNGADYTSLQIGFEKNGVLATFRDDRDVYSIGDTTVNISHKQAIAIATEYSETYSYAMSDGSRVSGFNVTEDQSTAKLVAYPINSIVLRPYWHVELYLNQTYPGYVEGLTIYVWANSGEVFLCSNIAHGGSENSDNSDFEIIDTSPSSSSSSENNTTSVDINTIAIMAVVVTIVIAASALFIKKRCR